MSTFDKSGVNVYGQDYLATVKDPLQNKYRELHNSNAFRIHQADYRTSIQITKQNNRERVQVVSQSPFYNGIQVTEI